MVIRLDPWVCVCMRPELWCMTKNMAAAAHSKTFRKIYYYILREMHVIFCAEHKQFWCACLCVCRKFMNIAHRHDGNRKTTTLFLSCTVDCVVCTLVIISMCMRSLCWEVLFSTYSDPIYRNIYLRYATDKRKCIYHFETIYFIEWIWHNWCASLERAKRRK